jgi:predicted Na+-dependent transporter
MRISRFIEKHFWLILIAGILMGLWSPVPFKAPPFLPKVLLGMMLFLAFLKIDALEVLENIRNFRLMIYIAFVYMLAIPLVFFFSTRIFNTELAVGILLLTAMPAGVSTPVLTDIAKGIFPFNEPCNRKSAARSLYGPVTFLACRHQFTDN